MSTDVIQKNLSAQTHRDWEVRSILAVSAHSKVGAAAQMFEFRRRETKSTFQFLFLGFGLGAGAIFGSSTNFVSPHVVAKDIARLTFDALWQGGRVLAGKSHEPIENPNWEKGIDTFTPLACETAFSAIDLHRSFGRLTTAAAALGLGYGTTFITAFHPTGRSYFSSQELVGGQAGGVGVGGSTNAGVWWHIG